MDANLTRYDIWVEGDSHESELIVEESESGEWVKFADIKESLSKSHNKQSTPLDKPTQFYCQNCGGKFTGVHFCNNRG